MGPRDLFEWAASRPTADIIDAEKKFLAREVFVVRQRMIGYTPPTSGGSPPVSLVAYRRAKAEALHNEQMRIKRLAAGVDIEWLLEDLGGC